MILVDSSFLIALTDSKDRWHRDAVRLRPRLQDPLVVSDLGLSEAVTVVGSRKGGKAAAILLEFLTDNCRIEFLDRGMLGAVAAVHLRYNGSLSLADAHALWLMESLGIREILSFDADFDKPKGVERLH